MPHITLDFTASAAIIVLLLAGSVLLSAFIYRHTVPPVARSLRILLTALRAAALFLLLMFLFEPLLRLVFTTQRPAVLAILMDNSKSMGITDRVMSRRDELSRVLASRPLRDLEGESDSRPFTFGASVKPLASPRPDSLPLTDDATDLSAALHDISVRKEETNIHAALLLTDGAYNLGQNPVYEAEHLGIPLYTIGIGDSAEQKDVLVSRIAANDLVYSDTRAPVDVEVKSSGYSGEHVDVTLSDGTRELDRKTITLGSGTQDYSVQLAYTPEGEGLKKYTVRTTTLPGELTVKNNQKSFFARILKSKLRVTILAGVPSPDLSIIKQTLREEKTFDVRSFAEKLSGGFYEGALPGQQLDSSDCIMLIGFPTATTGEPTLRLLTAAIAQHSTPVFFITGKSVEYARLQPFAGILPFTTFNTSKTEDYVFFQPSDAQRLNPVLAVPQSEGLGAWNQLPPIFRTQTSFRSKPEATVLGFARVQGILLKDPLILTRNVNRQKSLAVLGYGLWRWRLMTQGTPEAEQLLSAFLTNGIKWLTTHEDSRPVKVSTSKESYTQGEPVEFIGQVYDAAMQPVDNAQVRILVKQGDKEFESVMRPIGNGRYEGSIEGLGEGDYTFKGSALADGQQLGEDNGRFSVGELNLEFQYTRMNSQLLRQLAALTGGHYYQPEDLSTLVHDITAQPTFSSQESIRTSSLELWNWRYSLAVVIILFGLEWFLRKRGGML